EKSPAERERILINELGMLIRSGEKVLDYHTQALHVPVSFFTAAAANRPPPVDGMSPAFRIFVELEEDQSQQTQMLGVARRDLYLLPAVDRFEINFLKGMIGLWLLVLLLLGIALTLSTYLSGVIAWIATLFLYLLGKNLEFIQQVARGIADGGGPLESAW